MQELLIKLTLEMSIVGMTAYLFSQTSMFKKLVSQRMSIIDKMVMVIFFSTLSIIGTYRGIPIQGAIANTRAIGAIVAGLLGGPWVGLASGFIAGLHRYSLGISNPEMYGFTALACGLSTAMEGLFGGIIHKKYKNSNYDARFGFITGVIGEAMQMMIILLVARPFFRAWDLVQAIAIPMIFANSVGIAFFMNIVKNIRMEQERIGASEAHKALKIANETLPFLREGLDSYSAKRTIEIIYRIAEVDGICLTDREKILAITGIGFEHSAAGGPIISPFTKRVIQRGKPEIVTGEELKCQNNNKVSTAIIVPLKIKNETVGTLKIFQLKGKELGPMTQELALGLGQLLSTQLELAKLQEQAKLASTAELIALQSQINPHFLFNSLNTISSFCRTNPSRARQLIIELAGIFRKTLKKESNFIPLSEEIELVKSYLSLEKARFGDKIKVIEKIPADTLNFLVPSLILQPIVENSIKHGITPKISGGEVTIKVVSKEGFLLFTIRDTGVGISNSNNGLNEGAGIGLTNVNKRLQNLYGRGSSLKIRSISGKGTIVSFKIPKMIEGSEKLAELQGVGI